MNSSSGGKEKFKGHRFHPAQREQIERANVIIEEYRLQGYRLTARQLYYQFVSRNWISNDERSYKNLTKLIGSARLAGLMDWDGIEDRGRVPEMASEFYDLKELVAAAADWYRLPRWADQPRYVELWVEKQALAGVLSPLARKWHSTLMVNKGYSSLSAMHQAAKRFKDQGCDQSRQSVLFYLGDHDPSGEDMVRDIRDRLEMFAVERLEVFKIALTKAQIDEYQPPPNPAKFSDPRSGGYVAKHGASSWEVDALPPTALTKLINDAFTEVVDLEKWTKALKREARDKKRLTKAVEKLK
jgi:hypothetical protein